MVGSTFYWGTCSNMWCIDPEFVDILYFLILMVANMLNSLIALASMNLVFQRHCCPRRQRPEYRPESYPAVSVVVACYLPNEEAIIESTIEHIMQQLEWEGPLTLWVVYNTPKPMAFEQVLLGMDGREYGHNRRLRVVAATTSTSKAHNLNLVLDMLTDEYVALYDADHHPAADSLTLLMRYLQSGWGTSGWETSEGRYVAMQGSTFIRNRQGSLIARAVDAEFFVTHFVYFPAMELLGGTGYFGGSNALWRTAVLRDYKFDHAMLTEDVDLSARALLAGDRIGFCPRARSGELAPSGWKALVSQRLRWFMGWEQVTHKYYWHVFRTKSLSARRVLGFLYLFHVRWPLLLAAVLAAVINPVVTSPFIYPLFTWSLPIVICVLAAVYLYIFVSMLGIHSAYTHEQGRRVVAAISVAIFFVFGWVYVVTHFTLQSIAFVKVFIFKEYKWEVTARLLQVDGDGDGDGGGEPHAPVPSTTKSQGWWPLSQQYAVGNADLAKPLLSNGAAAAEVAAAEAEVAAAEAAAVEVTAVGAMEAATGAAAMASEVVAEAAARGRGQLLI